MTTWDRHISQERPQQRRKTPSFSSTLLDNIYHSIDETKGRDEPKQDFSRRDNGLQVEEEISSLRRAMMIEKWMENYAKYTRSSRNFNSDSSSSADSSMFSSSGTESASRSTLKSSAFTAQKLKNAQSLPSGRSEKVLSYETSTPKCEGRFTRTKSRALKIYGDLKKVKQPISPGSKITNFLNSIFNSRNLKKHQAMEDWSTSLRKSRSVKDSTTCTSFTSRSCLSKAPSPRSKSKRSVRFGPVSVIVGEDFKPCGQKSIDDNGPSLTSMPNISSHFIKQNISSLRGYEETKSNKYEFGEIFNQESDNDEDDDDDNDKSCTSSDLFELENIDIVGNGMHRDQELPVYGTTNLKINQAIAVGLFV